MQKNISLVIDSSILKQSPKLNSLVFTQLKKYIRLGIFKLYIPEVVEQEYLTWIKSEVDHAIKSAKKAIESLDKYYEKQT